MKYCCPLVTSRRVHTVACLRSGDPKREQRKKKKIWCTHWNAPKIVYRDIVRKDVKWVSAREEGWMEGDGWLRPPLIGNKKKGRIKQVREGKFPLQKMIFHSLTGWVHIVQIWAHNNNYNTTTTTTTDNNNNNNSINNNNNNSNVIMLIAQIVLSVQFLMSRSCSCNLQQVCLLFLLVPNPT